MRMKMSLWTLVLFLLPFVSRGNAGECQKPVLEDNVVLTESAILKNKFPDGSDVILECAKGYVRHNGSYTITCFSGQWSKQELTCKKKDCGLPPPTPNMKYNIPNGTLFGAYVTPVCNPGYRLQGSSHKQCLSSGWIGKSKCLLITCGKIPEIPHSIIVSHPSKESLDFKDVVEYRCEDKYTLVGNGSVVCQENGMYSSIPQCKVVTCEEIPEIPHSIIVSHPSKESLEFKDIIEYRCEDKYTLVGNGSVVCQENGNYSSLPQCQVVTCGEFPEIPRSIIVSRPIKESLEFKDVIEYRCEDKYTLVGNGSVVCQENGNFSSLPQCQGNPSAMENVVVIVIIVIATILVLVVIIIFVVPYYLKRRGSYDTGEEDKTKGALKQANSYSYKQAQYKGP
ncbi:CUB and sushi domain-containing protein 1 isoform X2 [Neoarius graeffei]|uniref:CUB and sushi domain-containing protein 1 isoform X2 n=1 Tax=Neoarius graeffei TaxID=443677 RepID=UPI00298BF2E5|nr:CUB and sushi domain-containing protein 1 isoform X2 [Neoarius graeffei]